MNKNTKVLSICQRKIPSAIVGVISLLGYLSKEGLIEFEFRETLQVTSYDIASADILLCIRGSEVSELRVVSECRRLGKYVIYFLDDDLLNITEMSNSYMYFKQRNVQKSIEEIMRMSNCLWTTSPNIKSKYGNYFESVLLTDAPAILLQVNSMIKSESVKEIVIGFAGGIDHEFFLEKELREPIKKILEKYKGRVRFEFFGAKPKFVDELSLGYVPYQSSYEDYLSIMASRRWDIALAPLPESEFHSCKYFNKYLEYGAIGVAGIYSKVEPYTYVIENGTNGILAENTTNAWVDVLSLLIESPTSRARIASNAKKHLESKFTIPQLAMSVFSDSDEIFRYKAPECDEKAVKLNLNAKFYSVKKAIQLLRTYNLRLPVYLVRKMSSYMRNRYM